MTYHEESKTVFQETMDPTPSFYLHDNRATTAPEASAQIPKQTALSPYEFTLGDDHDTHPADEAPPVAPRLVVSQKVVSRLVELPEHLPEDN